MEGASLPRAKAAASAKAEENKQAEANAADALLKTVLASLDDDKAEDIVPIELTGKSPVADHMVVCSGRSSRQVAAIAEKLAERVKKDHGVNVKMEGKEQGDWVLIDAGDVIVHVFRPEVREFYQLEKMWLSPGEMTSAPLS